MVHGLAAQLGGGFALTSAPGEGTRVDLYLPVAGSELQVRHGQPAEPIRSIGRRLSVLLVDDEELVRTATAEMIRDLGHDVEEASGGADALAKLDSGLAVDLLVTDYMMPLMNGGELARRVATARPNLPVLLITGYTGPANDVLHLPRLSKPFGQSEIAAALEGLFAADDKVVRFPTPAPRKHR
jgi:CheY-like chemotaxis protein